MIGVHRRTTHRRKLLPVAGPEMKSRSRRYRDRCWAHE